jgi:hypothetical protein
MRRALVLTNEAARHPFRQTLNRPRATRQTLFASAERRRSDLAFFGLSFVSFFIIIMGLIV